MPSAARVLPIDRLRLRWSAGGESTPWLPAWSVPAAMRGARAAVVVPGMFAFCDQVIGNLQMATFAAFGGFATLVLASFSGSRRDKLTAHTILAIAGSVLLTIGTAVNSSTLVAALVTIPVVFVVFFSGVAGPNAASGGIAALLAYVLPAASPGTMSMVPDRLIGWWLASIAGTAAVLLFSPPQQPDPLRVAATKLARLLAAQIDALVAGTATSAGLQACIEAKHELLARFTATPFRPTGLAGTDQALANGAELLEWCTSQLVDATNERDDLSGASEADRELLTVAAAVLRDAGALFDGDRQVSPDLERLDECRTRSIAAMSELAPNESDFREHAHVSFHACALAITILVIGADALVAAGRVDADWVIQARVRWFGGHALGPTDPRRPATLSRFVGVAIRHASVRSVWFINSMRGALAVAAAVAVADLSSVQHGFWVVLGTLSVLRTSAASTGSTAIRALTGTAIGFVIGGALLVAIGANEGVLWVALPIAVFVAAYAPGTLPFAVGQAAFTVTVAVLFNLLVPVGWKVGVVRIEDVAIGCAVSILVGSLFWPRGAASVVGDDLADAYRVGAAYLTQAVEWVCGLRLAEPSDAVGAVTTAARLDEGLRGLLTEQGTKHIRKEELWRLVGGTMRLRLTAHAVAAMPPVHAHDIAQTRIVLGRRAQLLDAWFDGLADQVGKPRGRAVAALATPTLDGRQVEGASHSRQTIWLCEHLDHLTEHLGELVPPATHLAEIRRRPWWR